MGFGGIVCLLIGLFSPIVSFGVLSVTFFQQGSYEGILLLILAVASAILLSKRNFVWLWATATNAGLLVVLSFMGRLNAIEEAKRKVETEMAGNSFRGLTDFAMQRLQLQWGWVFLIGGAVLLQVTLLKRSNRPPREAYIATLVVLGYWYRRHCSRSFKTLPNRHRTCHRHQALRSATVTIEPLDHET
jgi:hypothetical protein